MSMPPQPKFPPKTGLKPSQTPFLPPKWFGKYTWFGLGGLILALVLAGVIHGLQGTTAAITLPGEVIPIHRVQGRAHVSPQVEQTVTLTGLVTLVEERGFFLQSDMPDQQEITSEGLFVFTNSQPRVQVGQRLAVRGRVSEYRPGQAENDLTQTQLGAPRGSQLEVQVLAQNQGLPRPTQLSQSERHVPTEVIYRPAAQISPTAPPLDPQARGLDFYESLEGMRVEVVNPQVVGAPDRRGQFFVVADRGQGATGMNQRGGITIQAKSVQPYLDGDFNPERLRINPKFIENDPGIGSLQVGDQLESLRGILTYSWGQYELLLEPTQRIKIRQSATISPEVTQLQGDANHVTLASFNVENLSIQAPEQLTAIAQAIVKNLKAPDVIGLQEIQDDSGEIDNGTVSSQRTAQGLVEQIQAAGGPKYEYLEVTPQNNQDGGQPGGNIRVAFLFNPQRVQLAPSRQGPGTAQTQAQLTPTGLTHNPSRIRPQDPAWRSSRKPIIAQFQFGSSSFYVVNAHLASKRGDDALMGANQPPNLKSTPTRLAQSQVIQQFLSQVQQRQPQAKIVLLGDLNDFAFSEPVQRLSQSPLNLVNLTATNLDPLDQYSYIFQGNSQQLDHILVSQSWLSDKTPAPEVDLVHMNAEFNPHISDHDPVVARLGLG